MVLKRKGVLVLLKFLANNKIRDIALAFCTAKCQPTGSFIIYHDIPVQFRIKSLITFLNCDLLWHNFSYP